MSPVHFSWPGDTNSAHFEDRLLPGEDTRVSTLHQDQGWRNKGHEIHAIVQIWPATASGLRVRCLRVASRRW